jgi:hypothetical protein
MYFDQKFQKNPLSNSVDARHDQSLDIDRRELPGNLPSRVNVPV